jgi:hypothetical protein
MCYLFWIPVQALPVYLACARVSNQNEKRDPMKGETDVGVAGDVSDRIGNRVDALRVLVGNFNGELLFNRENNLRVRE